jgi:hypothetical protein
MVIYLGQFARFIGKWHLNGGQNSWLHGLRPRYFWEMPSSDNILPASPFYVACYGMKQVYGLLLLLSSQGAMAQDSTKQCAPFVVPALRHAVIATAGVGFIDHYRHNYDLPTGFEKSNTTGFAPIYAKLEYGLNNHVGVAAVFAYDNFVYNYNQLFDRSTGTVIRYHTDNFRLYSLGITANYHFTALSVPGLQPFISAGLSLNNIRHSSAPMGDSTGITKQHTISPIIKAGVRYYISSKFSVYGDVGYDKQSIFSLGVSCSFYKRSCTTK